MMTDQNRLNTRIRAIRLFGWVAIVATGVIWLVRPEWHHIVTGLLFGEFGGAYVVHSMVRQGHHNDDTAGAALFASGVVGFVTRIVVLAVVLIAAIKSGTSAVSALAGYLSGYILVFTGLAGYVRNPDSSSEESR
jgi:hypothetical protein